MALEPNLLDAERFIKALTGDVNTRVTWQRFTDQKNAEKETARIDHAALPAFANVLAVDNRGGMGVFVMVNGGDGKGRRTENVRELRALFVDDDEGALTPDSPKLSPLSPSIVVKSKHGHHYYWLLAPGDAPERFTPAQVQLASHFGTDPAVKDLPRVMRVPGFFHQKDPANPFRVRLIAASSRRYTIDQVLHAYPAGEPVAAAKTPAPQRLAAPKKVLQMCSADVRELLACFKGLNIVRWAMENPEDLSHEVWRGLATNIAAAVRGREDDEAGGLALFHEISALDDDRYSPADTERTFKDALKSAATHGPMTYETLARAGVPTEVCAAPELGKAPVVVARKLLERRRRNHTQRRTS